jgi:hypothetical protein
MLCLLLALSNAAQAGPPRIVGAPMVTNPRFHGVANTMMYDVTVTVSTTAHDAGHVARVGFVSEDDYTTCGGTAGWKWAHSETFDTTDTKTWTLYNFLPGKTYYYKVEVGGTGRLGRTRCGTLETTAAPTPTVPAALSDLNIRYEHGGGMVDSKYVLLETDDCGGSGGSFAGARDYVVVVDPAEEAIVWYLDVGAVSDVRGASGTGIRYQAGPTSRSGRILLSVNRRYVYSWGFDGSILGAHDFGESDECDAVAGSYGPCPHHDLFQSDDTGATYVMSSTVSRISSKSTDWEHACGSAADFIDDGYTVLDDTFAVVDEDHLMADHGYDPRIYGGPNATSVAARPGACAADTWTHSFDPTRGTIDWTHTNSIAASSYGRTEVIDLSLKEWSQVIRINPTNGSVVWRLSATPSDSDWYPIEVAPGVSGAATFGDQHDVHGIAEDTLMMFDNTGDPNGSRVLQMFVDLSTGGAMIEKSWAMVDGDGDPLDCPMEGTAELVPDSPDEHAFGVCKDHYAIVEMEDPTGDTGTPPPLVVSLPDGSRREGPFCASGGPTDRSSIRGWHRAFPLTTVGEF